MEVRRGENVTAAYEKECGLMTPGARRQFLHCFHFFTPSWPSLKKVFAYPDLSPKDDTTSECF